MHVAFAAPGWLFLLLLVPLELLAVAAADVRPTPEPRRGTRRWFVLGVVPMAIVALAAWLAGLTVDFSDGFVFARLGYLLVGLVLVPVVLLAYRSRTALAPGRRRTVLVVRVLLLLAVIVALAEPETFQTNEQLCVVFVVDRSDSMPAQLSPDWYRRYIQDKLTADFKAADDLRSVVLFAGRPLVQALPGKARSLPASAPDGLDPSITDIGAAVRQAMALFPEGVRKRIVLLTDGNSNRGNPLEDVRLADANDVSIDVVYPENLERPKDVRIERVIVPAEVKKDEPFELQIVLWSSHAQDVVLELSGSGVAGLARTRIPTRLKPGINVRFTPALAFSTAGFYEYRVEARVPRDPDGGLADAIPENNVGHGFTIVRGLARILLISGNGPEDDALERALGAHAAGLGKLLVRRLPTQMPTSIIEWQLFDSVVLSNIHAGEWTEKQMRQLATAVHENGVGLIMIGGERAFGAGGYRQQPIVEALPVKMEIEQRQVMPAGALVIILHSCEMPEANKWTKQMTKAALEALDDRDEFGIVLYDYSNNSAGCAWAIPLAKIGAYGRNRMVGKINQAFPGDMPDFKPAFDLAYAALAKSGASAKHCIVISDGDPGALDIAGVSYAAKQLGITTSGICVTPHTPGDSKAMRKIANAGGGRFYNIGNKGVTRLPQIFTQEAAKVRTSLIQERPFTPVMLKSPEYLEHFSPGDFPTLHGYVATTPKEMATVSLNAPEGPLLASWQYGLGRVVVFTSDARARWAREWTPGWGPFATFWGNLARWVQRRTVSDPNAFLRARAIDGRGRVTLDAVDATGAYRQLPRLEASVITPGEDVKRVLLNQVEPGRYEGEFQTPRAGNYQVHVTYDAGEGRKGQLVTGVSVPYAQEYRDRLPNLALVHEIPRLSQGVQVPVALQMAQDFKATDAYKPYWIQRGSDKGYNPFRTEGLPLAKRFAPVWPPFLIAALILLLLDVFFRKVMLEWAQVGALALPGFQRLGFLRGVSAEPATAELARLKAVKRQVVAERVAARDADRPGMPGFASLAKTLERAAQKASGAGALPTTTPAGRPDAKQTAFAEALGRQADALEATPEPRRPADDADDDDGAPPAAAAPSAEPPPKGPAAPATGGSMFDRLKGAKKDALDKN